ncbi:8062_t:CDS:2 [Entrophospora sp. SA101]|nr:8062_t:CDS:2 [Entrophospora sp. SA101]
MVENEKLLFRKIVNECNFLRSQNNKLWEIIGKQQLVIRNLQTNNQKLAV